MPARRPHPCRCPRHLGCRVGFCFRAALSPARGAGETAPDPGVNYPGGPRRTHVPPSPRPLSPLRRPHRSRQAERLNYAKRRSMQRGRAAAALDRVLRLLNQTTPDKEIVYGLLRQAKGHDGVKAARKLAYEKFRTHVNPPAVPLQPPAAAGPAIIPEARYPVVMTVGALGNDFLPPAVPKGRGLKKHDVRETSSPAGADAALRISKHD